MLSFNKLGILTIGLIWTGALTACGGEERHQESPADEPAPSEAPAARTVPEAPTGPVDPDLVAQGQSAFTSRGCVGCHTIGGGRLTGPDLQGVTERREYPWMIAMITNPDSMIRADSIAKALFAEYMTPMLNVGLTATEARAIYEYLRSTEQ